MGRFLQTFQLIAQSRYGLLLGLLLVIGLRPASFTAFPLMDETESRYATIPLIMVQTGDWITPQTEIGTPFWSKPPLSFWVTAVIYRIFGIGEFQSRLSPFLLSVMTVALTILAGVRLGSRRTGWTAGLILVTTVMFYITSGMVMTDQCLTTALTVVMVSLPMMATAGSRAQRTTWGVLFFVGTALAILAKGPVALVVTFIALVSWIIWSPAGRAVFRLLPWKSGIVIFSATAVPWFVLEENRHPGFLHYYLVGEHWLRFTQSGWKSLYGDSHEMFPGAIWIYLFVGALPWSIVLLQHRRSLLRTAAGKDDAANWCRYFICWALSPILFFTPSRNILPAYILPALPAIAVLYSLVSAAEMKDQPAGAEIRTHRWHRLYPALVPVLFTVLAFTLVPMFAREKSHRSVLQAFQSFEPNRDAKIVYFDDAPSSALFYSGDGGLDSCREKEACVARELSDSRQVYFVIERADLRKFPGFAIRQTEIAARIGKLQLRRTPDPEDSQGPGKSGKIGGKLPI